MDLDAAVREYRRALAAIDTTKQAAARRVLAARTRADQAREQVHTAMVDLARGGVRPIELARRTGYTRERVRQILRAHGVEPPE